eukprot:8723358-Alexandrium_andersonii.AAC.1
MASNGQQQVHNSAASRREPFRACFKPFQAAPLRGAGATHKCSNAPCHCLRHFRTAQAWSCAPVALC